MLELPPDPRALDGLGRNHSFETALADLVDNSIDAAATKVAIRIVLRSGRPTWLCVVDNGRGMTPYEIDGAMTLGGRREYRSDDLGRFGLGLKAASFSQARSLTVLSKASGWEAVGRRWQLDRSMDGFHCDYVPAEFAEREITGAWGLPSEDASGTVVRWDEVSAFPMTEDSVRVDEFLTRTVSTACSHLGLVFHRHLESRRVAITVEIQDVDNPGGGTRVEVTPVNPFGYTRSGKAEYPKSLVATSGSSRIVFRCHIWPGRANTPQFKLPAGPIDSQGLYFYRRDRLLHIGGWDGIHAPDRRLQLARVEVDIDDDIAGLFKMNPEKSRILVGPEFGSLSEAARAGDGTSFTDYLTVAEEVFRASRKRSNSRKPMIPPGKGFPPKVRDSIEDEIPAIPGAKPIDIRWKRFNGENFFEVDREGRTLWLNGAYRAALSGGRRGGLNDLPMIKTLLYLVVENVFQGEWLGVRDRDNIELWQELLTVAAKSELASAKE
ncbi:ATP-binding protein [Kutzneria sp. NPDC052558]|uniref:ATP-binding protein n=1 Tax=Kutzneria sp. NPDC052558 TaxID=3364121 RepID=UPI0037C96331